MTVSCITLEVIISLRCSVLASGSSGNSVLVGLGGKLVLIDLGISYLQLCKRLATLALNVQDIDAIFITHEHMDHVRGVRTFLNKHDVPVYLNKDTYAAISERLKPVSQENILFFPPDTVLDLDQFKVYAFSISHDAAHPVGYRLTCNRQFSISVVTDIGYVSSHVHKAVIGSHILVWEFNHDVAMLCSGRYPWNIKKRILSCKGHLSNEESAHALCKILDNSKNDHHIYLAHLSKEHNVYELAYNTVKNYLSIDADDEKIKLFPTYSDKATPLRAISGVF